MGVKKVEDLIAFQLSRAFKLAVYAVVNGSSKASADFRYRDQLFDAASSGESNVDEGFHRYGAGEMVHFLSIARASIAEAKRRLADGVDRGHFEATAVAPALELGRRAGAALAGLQRSLKPFTRREQQRQRRTARTPATR
jgi:four helix bundle protein